MNLTAADRKLSDIPYSDLQETLDTAVDGVRQSKSCSDDDLQVALIAARDAQLAFIPRND